MSVRFLMACPNCRQVGELNEWIVRCYSCPRCGEIHWMKKVSKRA